VSGSEAGGLMRRRAQNRAGLGILSQAVFAEDERVAILCNNIVPHDEW